MNRMALVLFLAISGIHLWAGSQKKSSPAERIQTWKAAIESVGGSMTVPEATGQMVTTKPAPLGHIKRP